MFLVLDVIFWQSQSFPKAKMNAVNRQEQLLTEIDRINKDINYLKKNLDIVSKESKQVDLTKINYRLKDSTIYVNSEFDEVPITIDFRNDNKKKKKNIFQFNFPTQTNTQIKGAVAVDVQLIWCSQFVSGYLTMGPQLSKFENYENTKNFEWDTINDLQDFRHNTFALYTIYNDRNCQTQNEKIQLADNGAFFIQSQGYNNKTKVDDSSDDNNMNELDTGRNVTQLSLIVKGQQIFQELPQRYKFLIPPK